LFVHLPSTRDFHRALHLHRLDLHGADAVGLIFEKKKKKDAPVNEEDKFFAP